MGPLSSRSGLVLVLVLLVLAILVALVTEFTYSVYTTTSSLYNWSDGQRLSELSDSGLEVAKGLLKESVASMEYTYPERVLIPVPLIDTEDSLTLEIIDEQGRFNINSIVYKNGNDNTEAMETLKRLFKLSGMDENLTDYIADWIDPDSEPRRVDSEAEAKNAPLYTIAELRYIKGIDEDVYKAIKPYVTVYGDSSGKININTADKLVIMSLSDNKIDENLAEVLITYRDRSPFKATYEIKNVPGFSDDIMTDIAGKYVTKSDFFRIRAVASFRELKRIAEAVVELGRSKVLYYKMS